jgi:hypothetical protein
MKIEIDSSRPEDLKKLKREHEFALQMIDAALLAIGKNDRDSGESNFPQIVPPRLEQLLTAPDTGVAGIIAALPIQFDMRQAKTAADAAEIPDSRLRREIKRQTDIGTLVLVERGQGRRPASFRKA